MYRGRNQSGDPMKKIGSPPRATIALLTIPDWGENSRWIMPTTTTTEMNDGEYRTVCVNFLNLSLCSWLTISARMIGTGKAMSSPRALTVRVLARSLSNWNELMKRSKCSRPTHGLPEKPSAGL